MPMFRTALLLAIPLSAALLVTPAAAVPAAKPATQQQSVKDGVDAWKGGDYQRAVAIWRPLAVAGDPDAQFNLGQAYKLGRGVPTDLLQAEAWYRRAADQGYLQAEDNLGLVLFTANRREEAMHYIVRSAARGEPRAQYVLGTAHFNGDLAAEDWPRAYALTKRASDAGLSLASARLAQLDGLIPLDQRQAGLAMLPQIEKDEARARLAAVNAAAPPSPKAEPAPSPVKTASLPASVPGTSYTPPPVIRATPTPPPTPPRSPAANAAAAAAAEASAQAAAATEAAPSRATPQPVAAAEVPSSTPAPAAPGTSYAPPPERGDPGRDAPRPAPAKAAPAPVKAASPKPQPAAPAAVAAPTRPDVWRAQLGAFSVDGSARKLWLSLERKYPALTANQPYLVQSGKLTRLQAGNFATKAEADKFCTAVKSPGQPCVAVRK